MAGKIQDFYAGDTCVWKFVFSTGGQTPTPIDITGWVLEFVMKPTSEDADSAAVALVEHDVGDNPLDDATNGVAYVTLPSDVSGDIIPGSYAYAFRRIIAGTPPDVRTLLQDKVKVKDAVRDTAGA